MTQCAHAGLILAASMMLGCGAGQIGPRPSDDRLADTPDVSRSNDSSGDTVDAGEESVDADPPLPAVCGDGVCDPDRENASSCALDCGGNAAASCLRERCAEGIEACLANSGCTASFDCLLACTDATCAQQCYLDGRDDTEATGLLESLLDCGQTERCFDGCGDGTCQGDETGPSCPSDCGYACVASECPAETTTCATIVGCDALLQCWSSCGTYDCQVACVRTASPAAIAGWKNTLACVRQTSCIPDTSCGDGTCAEEESEMSCPEDCLPQTTCGDGVCQDDETTATCPADCIITEPPTCEGKCGSYNADWACQCDLECDAYGDCCIDVQPLCGLDFCGDGACTGGEDAMSCPEECEPAGLCGDDACGPGEDAQVCPEDCPESCGDGLCTQNEDVDSCEPDCGPLSCKDKCGAFIEGGPCQCDGACLGRGDCCQDIYAQCGVSLCGDGACTEGEDAETCALDCPSECGDSNCTGPETVATCVVDCFASCAQASCNELWSQCQSSAECLDAVTTCTAACEVSVPCSDQCEASPPADSPEPFTALVTCAAEAGCLP